MIWNVSVSERSLIRNTMALLCSYAKKHFSTFNIMLSHADLKLVYTLFYFFFYAVSFYVAPDSHKALDKIIRDCCTKYDSSLKEGFMSKIIVFDAKKNSVNFIHLKAFETNF